MFLAGDFLEAEAVARAVVDLKANGFTPEELAVFSEEPVEFPRDVLYRPSHMSLAAVIGAILSGLLAIAFVYFTQHNYPIITGGMPTFSFWATGVIFYELILLGGIITTFVWFLGESGLLRRRSRAPALLIEPGRIGLRIACDPNRSDAVREVLGRAGAENIRTLGDPA